MVRIFSTHILLEMEIKIFAAENITGDAGVPGTMLPASTSSITATVDTMESDFNTLFNAGEGVFLTILLGFLCIFGLVANSITFWVIATSKNLRTNPFNVLILSLSVSDFFSALNSPLQIYRAIWGYLEFNMPEGVCKFTIGLSQLTMFVTVQHILVFSILRVVAILSPHKVKNNFSPKGAKIVACCIWIEVFFAYALFYIITATVVPYSPGRYKTACTAVSKEWRPVGEKYVAVALPIMLFAPFVGILLCAIIFSVTLIKIRLQRAKGSVVDSRNNYPVPDSEAFSDYKELEDSEKFAHDLIQEQENAALLQVTLIVFSFVFGYAIDAAYRMTKALDLRHLFNQRTKWLTVTIAYVCLRISECLNPLFYNLASSQMRESTKSFLSVFFKSSQRDGDKRSNDVTDEKKTSTKF